eukprot:CCRYP_017149-RB/>CCRYP_017149-RB protein AED:0.55 eAED:0.42 QI:0/0/0/0.5/0.66/0.5/4/0/308
MIVDGAKEMRLGEFARSARRRPCLLQSTEPYSPWSNSAEREIRELKKGAARKLTRSGALAGCDGRVPETVASGETADISPFCEFGFGIGLSFVTKALLFLATPSHSGKYLGPSIDRDPDGSLVGTAHANPAPTLVIYEVRFPDGRTEELAANVIAEAVYAQCDADGNQYVLLDAIVDYRKDPSVAVARNDQVSVADDCQTPTRGWELCCEWKDGSTSWQKLSDLKESHPLQVAEFAFAAQIADEPAFNWWVSWVLKKRDRIVSLVSAGADTTSGLISMGLNSPRLLRKPMPSIVPPVLPSGMMRLKRR